MKLSKSFALAMVLGLMPHSAKADNMIRYLSRTDSPTELVVYFHGLGSNLLEPYKLPTPTNTIGTAILDGGPNLALCSFDYSPTEILNGDTKYDTITKNISRVLTEHPSLHNIILCGSSLGGFAALAYLHYAPVDLSQKIKGVLAVEVPADLSEWYQQTSAPQVKEALNAALGGAPAEQPQKYSACSLKALLKDTHLQAVNVVLISGNQDTIVPPLQQKHLKKTLQQLHCPCKLVTIEYGHGVKNPLIYTTSIADIRHNRMD